MSIGQLILNDIGPYRYSVIYAKLESEKQVSFLKINPVFLYQIHAACQLGINQKDPGRGRSDQRIR